ncbi:MAG: tRNA (guanosine(46)-N7)-methyltransferase TrmB [Deltaproteobacteria bacterium]|nr:tRNA (guanosine(46)-N7)-methyltransferase TrmB [Deltaproteobacteria bacterium]MBI2974602.1 tRNA (guanosine(46)-N7)-methyltransferase TrmB [Deltaproteobacteria bacterium]
MPIRRTENGSKWDKTPLCYPATLNAQTSDIILEIGPGRGDFLFYLAANNPRSPVIGIELKSKRYFKLIERTKNLNIANVQIMQADGRDAVAKYFNPESVKEIHVNFPDPWPKRKHVKNRLLGEEFIKNCARILAPEGFLSFITDVESYAADVKNSIKKYKLESLSISTTSDEVFPTYFAQKWKKEGRKFYSLKLTKLTAASI